MSQTGRLTRPRALVTGGTQQMEIVAVVGQGSCVRRWLGEVPSEKVPAEGGWSWEEHSPALRGSQPGEAGAKMRSEGREQGPLFSGGRGSCPQCHDRPSSILS